jgi:type II secretory ATPase GspE/PulE/Tfp pilus assembly ATPase PilB-like protein
MSDRIRDTMLTDPSIHALRRACVESGMTTLRQAAFQLVAQGRTTLEESMRVVLVDEEADGPIAKAMA